NPYPDVQPQDPFFEADGIRQAVTGEDGLGNALFLNPGSINLAQTNNIKTNFQPYMLADLMVQKSVNPPSGHSRLEPVDFVIHVTNEGPSDATEVVVTELLNNRYLFVSYVASQGAYDPVTGKWEVGNLINQASATLTITAN